MPATDPVQAVAEAHPNYGMSSHRMEPYCTGCGAAISAVDGSVSLGWVAHVAEAAVAAARPLIEREAKAEALNDLEGLLGRAWDDGNAVGLDGWVGPERGTEPDSEGINARERHIRRAMAAAEQEGQ